MRNGRSFVPVIRNFRVSHIVDVIAECATDARRATEATALCRRFDASGPLTVPVRQMLALLEQVAAVADIDDLGLRVGARYHPADWGAYGYLFLNSPTLLQALKGWVRITREEQEGAHARLLLREEGLRVEYAILQPAGERRRQDAELTLAALMQAVRVVAGAATVPHAVHFEHRKPRHVASHRALFRAPLHFEMGLNAIVFDRALAARPVPNADARLLSVIDQFVGRGRPRSERASFEEVVTLAIRPLLSSGQASLGVVSRQLGMSPRSVQRTLAASGLSFGGCLDAVRRAVAEELLTAGELEVKEIAALTGFSGSPALCRAYKRWTGRSPRQPARAAR